MIYTLLSRLLWLVAVFCVGAVCFKIGVRSLNDAYVMQAQYKSEEILQYGDGKSEDIIVPRKHYIHLLKYSERKMFDNTYGLSSLALSIFAICSGIIALLIPKCKK
jgi:hypothetical protein